VSRYAISLLANLTLLGPASMATLDTAFAGSPVGVAPAANDRQIMLYVNQPLWSRGVSLRMFGLRIDKLRPLDSVSIQRTTLIDLQLRAHSDFRVEFGRRVTWNIRRGEFGPEATSGNFQMSVKNSRLADPLTPPIPGLASYRMNPLAADPIPVQQAMGGRHALEAELIHPHWSLTQSWGSRASDAPPQSATKMKIVSFGSVRCCAR
jgi:hypothetical protein